MREISLVSVYALVVLLSGCTEVIDPDSDAAPVMMTDETSAATTSAAPGFPSFSRISFEYEDELNDMVLSMRHEQGPCIVTADYRWEFTPSKGQGLGQEAKGIHQTNYDGSYRHSGGPLEQWCIHDVGAIQTDSDRPGALRVYRLADGQEVFSYTFPPWPPNVYFTRDDNTDRLTVASAGSDIAWNEMQIRLPVEGKYGFNSEPSQRLAPNMWTTLAGPDHIAAGSYLEFCTTAGLEATVEMRATASGAAMGSYTFRSLLACA